VASSVRATLSLVGAAASRLSPAQSLSLGFATLTLMGALALTLPLASTDGTSQSFVDALFMATSAVTTTGLGVVDTGGYYSLFGELVILALFQVGGLGYMAFFAFLVVLLGRRLTFRAGAALEQSMAGFSPSEVHRFVRLVFIYTAVVETVGAFVLGAFWLETFGPRAFYLGIFHSVSAFCTAGFSLFSDSFMSYRDSAVINLTLAVITWAGAVGFFVLGDLTRYAHNVRWNIHPRRLSTHTKLVLVSSTALVAFATVVLLATEAPEVLGRSGYQRFLAATFQTLSASTTTGFNSVDIGAMSPAGLFVIILLMFVGASPGGTGGGIKTTTLAVAMTTAVSMLRGRKHTQVFWRLIPEETVRSALAIGLLATGVTVAAVLLLTATEDHDFLRILFEVSSALGTVGLSAGITAGLTTVGKLAVSVVMLIGRLGPLAVGFALLADPDEIDLRYAKEDVFVG